MEFVTDSGFILQNLHTISTYFATDPRILYYGKRDPIIADIVIQSKPLGQKVKRSYIKFQDFLTKIGGLIKAITLLGSLIIQFTSNIEFYNDYINNLFLREHAIQEHMSNITKLYSIKSIHLNKPNTQTKKDLSSNISEHSMKEIEDKIKLPFSLQMKINNFTKHQEKPLNEEEYNKKKSKMSFGKIFTGISQSNYNYPTYQAFKEFFIQLCPCSKDNGLKKFKNNIELKMNKSLSIEVILEKLYLIEVLSLVSLTEPQEINAYNLYVESLKKSVKNQNNVKIFDIKREEIKGINQAFS